jgi:methylated-DNA-[protein]-cysteine S-methyltransferase
LDAYFSGAVDALDPVAVDPSGWTAFFAEVYRRCRQIAPGNTRSYQELAALAGRPRAARAVGQAMAQNRVPLVIPCHRVLSAGGGLGGYSGPGGVDTKLWLLRHESEATRGDGDRPGDHAERARFCLKRGPTL